MKAYGRDSDTAVTLSEQVTATVTSEASLWEVPGSNLRTVICGYESNFSRLQSLQ